MIQAKCNQCGSHSISIADKIRASNGARLYCPNCRARLMMSSMWRWVVALAASLVVLIFIFWFVLVGFTASILLTIISQLLIYLVVVYWVPLSFSES